jgi:hypothetical protein
MGEIMEAWRVLPFIRSAGLDDDTELSTGKVPILAFVAHQRFHRRDERVNFLSSRYGIGRVASVP